MKASLQTTVGLVASLLFCVAIAQRSSAASTTVLVGSGGDVFTPPSVSISVNDSVIWSWASGFHSTTSGVGNSTTPTPAPDGLWDSGIIFSAPHFFTNTFTSAGTFTYYCSEHYSLNMTGEVVVAGSATLPPGVGISSPANGAVFAAPANVSIQASVTNGSGMVTNVEFLVDNSVVASEDSGPFSTTANGLVAGGHSLSAIAKDSGGLSATNSVNISVVTPTTVSLTNSSRLSGTDFQFSYSADVGLNYVVQRSSDLLIWTPLVTNTAASNPVVFDDPNATNDLDFYRVGRLPNP